MTHPLPHDGDETLDKPVRGLATAFGEFPDPDKERGWLNDVRRHAPAIVAGGAAVLLIAGGVIFVASTKDTPAPRPAQEFQFVQVVPPPPPPPPPEPEQQQVEPEPEPEPEMIEQPEMTEPEVQEEAEVEEPNDALPDEGDDEPPLGPLGLDAEGEGPADNYNLVGNPGGNPLGRGGGGGGGSRWGWYAAIVQQQIESALRANPKTRSVVMRVQVRLWADGSGRVTRVQLVSSTGNPEVDAAIRGEALAGMRLREPPPADMPMPVVARVTARRPG